MAPTTTETVTRLYGNFRGVDFRGEEVNLSRSPDSLNMWKDYRQTDGIRTRPGLKKAEGFPETVYGVFFYTTGGVTLMIVHSGDKLYRICDGEREVLYDGVSRQKSDSFLYNGTWYFKDGAHYLQYDGTAVHPVEGYVPTTSIGRKPAGGGTTHEDVNLLTGRRINTFVADGESTRYYLDAQELDTDFVPVVKVDGVAENQITVDYAAGMIEFTKAPQKPGTDGQDNVSVEFSKTVAGYYDRIAKCKLLQVFDNRTFFSGNDEFPNMIWHCSLNNPAYCSDTDYYNEGLDASPVRGIVAGNNGLWVFKEPSQANTAVFYHTPTQDSDYGKIYPSNHSSIATGCIGGAINFGDDIVFFSDRGMEGINGDITTEQFLAHRSSMVDSKLISQSGYRDMVLEEWDGYLMVFIGNKVFLADSRATFSGEGHREYEWFYWELEQSVVSTRVQNGVLYIGTEDGVYTLTDGEKNMESYWVTPKDRFNYPHMQKTTNKRGCTVEATGDISLFAKTEGTDFELIETFESVYDYFAARVKRKKFKDLQLKFYSDTRFSLETATMECIVGGYIKR